MKYPIEIELSSYCSLRCKSCINKDLKEKYFLDMTLFQKLIDFLYSHRDELLCIDLAGIGDAFLNPHILEMLSYISETFSQKSLVMNISQKGQRITPEHLDMLQGMQEKNCIEVNFYVGIFSIREDVYRFLSGGDSFQRVISFVKELKSKNFSVSLELLNNYFSHQEYDKFFEISKTLSCTGYVKNITNYGGSMMDSKGYLFGYNNKAEEKELGVFTKNGADSLYLQAQCSNTPYFRADGKITMCSNLQGFPDRGILGSIDHIESFSSLKEIYEKSQIDVFSEVCSGCSMNKGENNFCAKDYYIDTNGSIIRDPVLIKVFDIHTAEDIISIYENDKKFVYEVVNNPDHIHKHEKIDFIQILDLVKNVHSLSFHDFSHAMLVFWKLEAAFSTFHREYKEYNNIEDFPISEVSRVCKMLHIEPLEYYFFAYTLEKISINFYRQKIFQLIQYAIKVKNSVNIAYLQLTLAKAQNGPVDPNFGQSLVFKYFGLFHDSAS